MRASFTLLVAISLGVSTMTQALWLPWSQYHRKMMQHVMVNTGNEESAVLDAEDYGIASSASLCATDNDIFEVESITLTPDPPQKGQPLVIEARGTLKEDVVAGAIADVRVKLGLIKLFEQRLDICEQIKQIDLECPIQKGYHVIERSIQVPNELPTGKYTVHINGSNADARPITCVNVEFRM
ncbi:hypothetical protein SeLEV6574_g07012 [Synchytrium endobioticum]|nr:hypothetical protein SeLEV6574_g07012 [Synchytrium endobioticum]